MPGIDFNLWWESEKAACRRVPLDEWLTCKRKVRYGREATARKACAEMLKKTGDVLEAYECPYYCGGWHIGHNRNPARKKTK